MNPEILKKEICFHDNWAESINLDEIMVDECFEACTAPENRLILKELGDLSGKKLLDLGCG
ncbi:MAG: SAM-dependent methyltransferase, partial [Nitrospirae bacterium]|nr:SAM-dependent methyltransferase [Nitrospirota bacterium]